MNTYAPGFGLTNREYPNALTESSHSLQKWHDAEAPSLSPLCTIFNTVDVLGLAVHMSSFSGYTSSRSSAFLFLL